MIIAITEVTMRAVERAERAEHRRIGRRRPPRRQQEGKSECPDGRPGARDQGQNDAAENEQHRNRAGAGDPVECNVAELEGVERPGAIVGSGGFHHIALNGHVCHANPLSFNAARKSLRVRASCTDRFDLVIPGLRRQAATRNRYARWWQSDWRELARFTRAGMTGYEVAQVQLLMSADQVFSISLTTESGIGM